MTVADDGRQGFELFGKDTFDLVITDIWMPNMDGFELLRSIKKINPEADIVIITGFADVESSIKALRLGASNYLLKPLNLEELSFSVDSIHKKQMMVQRLAEQEARLIQVGKMADLGLVAAGVAHEINNPNAFIRGNAQTLQKFWKVIDPFLNEAMEAGIDAPSGLDFIIREMPPLINSLLEGTNRIKKIVEATASFTRYNEAFYFQPVDINQCVKDAVHCLNASETGLQLELEPELKPVSGIRADMVEVITELLKNSNEATRNRDCPDIRIRTSQPNPDIIKVEIEDNGTGIKAEHENRIFTPFFSTDPKIGHPGLGLTKVFALVRGFGGDVYFKSSEGKGAIFTVKLPVYHKEGQTDGIADR